LNLRPSGYEPDELPGCSTPRLEGIISLRVREYGGLRAWRRPTLPHLLVQYHWRGGFSRPSSGWDRVFGPSLWPPGRQSLSPRKRGSLSCAVEVSGGRVPVDWALLVGQGLAAARGRCCPAEHGSAAAQASLRRVQAPIERLVPVSSTGCPAFTSGLSTWWSSTALGETWF
jgi:hypothetical protein